MKSVHYQEDFKWICMKRISSAPGEIGGFNQIPIRNATAASRTSNEMIPIMLDTTAI